MTALEWILAKSVRVPESALYCESRDTAQARVEKIPTTLCAEGWSEEHAAAFASILGELTNNSFDHNLGAWRDVPGCWLEMKSDPAALTGIVGDRGRGVLASLAQAHPEIVDEVDALRRVFQGGVTGRAPEPRGNGLRYIWSTINAVFPGATFRFYSGGARLELFAPKADSDLRHCVSRSETAVPGVYAEIVVQRANV